MESSRRVQGQALGAQVINWELIGLGRVVNQLMRPWSQGE